MHYSWVLDLLSGSLRTSLGCPLLLTSRFKDEQPAARKSLKLQYNQSTRHQGHEKRDWLLSAMQMAWPFERAFIKTALTQVLRIAENRNRAAGCFMQLESADSSSGNLRNEIAQRLFIKEETDMRLHTPAAELKMPLDERVRQQVLKHTNGMIQGLQVDLLADHLVLTGRTNSYYAKQLASHAAMNTIDEVLELTNDIRVG
ncbi:hypothetical protein CA54_24280 [Symmachiella macrocystis]|uniref:BON domain protein n=2 Tax=Symmachiella macrocystis TaxID=2527985 RepID=A0A5C6BN66_9PLAN|nr:hypothetical protein CA54_24280 [Symmachiella macrocystis]